MMAFMAKERLLCGKINPKAIDFYQVMREDGPKLLLASYLHISVAEPTKLLGSYITRRVYATVT